MIVDRKLKAHAPLLGWSAQDSNQMHAMHATNRHSHVYLNVRLCGAVSNCGLWRRVCVFVCCVRQTIIASTASFQSITRRHGISLSPVTFRIASHRIDGHPSETVDEHALQMLRLCYYLLSETVISNYKLNPYLNFGGARRIEQYIHRSVVGGINMYGKCLQFI